MKNIISFILILFFGLKVSYAQSDNENNNSIYFELYGNAGTLGSGSYERRINFDSIEFLHLGLRLGLGIGTNSYDETTNFTFPLEISGIFGKKKHFLEIGIGYTFYFGTSNLNNQAIPTESKTNFYTFYVFRLGYRFVGENGFFIRAAPLGVIINDPLVGGSPKFKWWGGISFGISF